MSEIVRVPFHGGDVSAIDIDGKPHVLFRPVVESMGLAYSSQLQRLKRRSWASSIVTSNTVAADGKTRPMVAVDTRTLTMWLATIDENKVDGSIRPLLVAYQREVADAIDDYWAKGAAINPRAGLGQPMDELELAELNVRLIKEKRALTARAEKAESKLAVAAPKADAWDALASAEGDFSVGDAAKILCRDLRISIGQNRLFELLGSWGWLFRQKSDDCWRVIQDQADCGRLSERPSHRYSRRTGKKVTNAPQVRVSVKGLKEIRQRLVLQPALFEIEAAA